MSAIVSPLAAGVIRAQEGERISQAGTTLTFKSLGRETGGAAFIYEQASPPGAVVPSHLHQNEDEFVYLLEGEVEVTIGDARLTVGPGDLVKMPRGVPHGIRMTGTGPARSLWTVVPAGKMEDLFRALGALPTDRPPDPGAIARIMLEHDVTPVPPPDA